MTPECRCQTITHSDSGNVQRPRPKQLLKGRRRHYGSRLDCCDILFLRCDVWEIYELRLISIGYVGSVRSNVCLHTGKGLYGIGLST